MDVIGDALYLFEKIRIRQHGIKFPATGREQPATTTIEPCSIEIPHPIGSEIGRQ